MRHPAHRLVLSCLTLTLMLTLVSSGSDGTSAELDPDGSSENPPLQVSVMTFNIRYGTANDGDNRWPKRRELVLDMIDEHAGDFIGLQEALRFQLDEIRNHVPRYAETGVGRADGKDTGEFSAILYDNARWRLDPDHHGTFWLSDTPDTPGSTSWGNRITRIVTFARFIERSTGRAVWLYNTHFDHESQPSRERSAVLLARHIAERPDELAHEPLVITGDFNAGEDNPAIQYLKGEAELDGDTTPRPLVDTFRAAHPDAEDVGTFNGFNPSDTTGEKIDYIFTTPDATVRSASILRDADDGRTPSDHFPLTAILHWEA